MKRLYVLFLIALGVSFCKQPLPNEVPYPEGYRNWIHTKTLELKEKHPLYKDFGGIHHIYINPIGFDALKNKKPFPDGTIIVFDLLDVVSDDQVTAEAARKVLGVMYKNSKAFPETKGWGFEAFKGNTRERLINGNHNACFGCHASQADKDYVFSEYRE